MPLFCDLEAPLFDIRLVDSQQMPIGYWVVIQVFAPSPEPRGLYRMRLLWKRSPKRKKLRTLRIRGPVEPVEVVEVDPFIADDWVWGVEHKKSYGFLVDTHYHCIADDEDVHLDSVVQPISVLDMIQAGVADVPELPDAGRHP